VLLFDLAQSADAAADQDTVAKRVSDCEVDPRLGNRFVGCDQAELTEPIHPSDFAVINLHVVGRCEVGDFTAETDFEIGAIKASQRADTAFSGAETVPELGEFTSQARDNSHSRNDDASGHPLVHFPKTLMVSNRQANATIAGQAPVTLAAEDLTTEA
jgi:hypothetical protein